MYRARERDRREKRDNNKRRVEQQRAKLLFLNAGLMHELGQLRENQIVGAEKQGVVAGVRVTARLHRIIGAEELIQGVVGRGSVVIGRGCVGGGGGDGGGGCGHGVGIMVVRVGRSGNGEQQRRGGAVDRLHPRPPGVRIVILTLLGILVSGLDGVERVGICRVFVNVCEVREWSWPGVAA